MFQYIQKWQSKLWSNQTDMTLFLISHRNLQLRIQPRYQSRHLPPRNLEGPQENPWTKNRWTENLTNKKRCHRKSAKNSTKIAWVAMFQFLKMFMVFLAVVLVAAFFVESGYWNKFFNAKVRDPRTEKIVTVALTVNSADCKDVSKVECQWKV